MPISEMPPPLETDSDGCAGQQLPLMRTEAPGPMGRSFASRLAQCECSMVFDPCPGEQGVAPPITYMAAQGSNVVDADGNRYVDMAANFGALLLGHNPNRVAKSVEVQMHRTWTGLGDMCPADVKIAMLERVVTMLSVPARALLCQSGSDAVTCAIKTAVLHTGSPGLVAFDGCYHGLGLGPLSVCGYSRAFREPFFELLSSHAQFAHYPHSDSELDQSLQQVKTFLASGKVAAVIVEPVLGRGGCIAPPAGFLAGLRQLTREAGTLLIADEIWTGLGRTGSWLACDAAGVVPDLVCLGKGLGGGMPISACVGERNIMDAWQHRPGTVHTSTFQGHALCCAASIATIDALRAAKLAERAARVGQAFQTWLRLALDPLVTTSRVTGVGLMVGVAFDSAQTSRKVASALLQKGFIVVPGGTRGEALTLTPALTIDENLLEAFVDTLAQVVRELA